MPTKPPTETYEQFDVVVVPFPFTDVTATKRRPALVLSDAKNFNSAQKQNVMAMITSQENAGWLLDVIVKDLETAGLNNPSVIRMKLFTLDTALVVRKIGTLGAQDQAAVRLALQSLLKF